MLVEVQEAPDVTLSLDFLHFNVIRSAHFS